MTGKLAEPALRKVLAELTSKLGFHADVAVLPITVAALLTTDWVRKKLTIPSGIERIILPGFCAGELQLLQSQTEIPIERGPKDLRDLPDYFGQRLGPPSDYGFHTIEILAEINHAPRLTPVQLDSLAEHYRKSGAEIIDLGCNPGEQWHGIGDAVRRLRASGHRVSVDSFHPVEVTDALAAGAEMVLSVNSTNREAALRWHRDYPHVVVIAIPDTPTDLDSLRQTHAVLADAGVPHRLDPILEPIGHGFAESLARYYQIRKEFPNIPMLMGVGNLTELTDVDSAGVNVMLAGFCEELKIGSVLTTEVANPCRSAVREFALARRLVAYAVRERILPKRLEPGLNMWRDRKVQELGEEVLLQLSQGITDRNYRIFVERGAIHIMNSRGYVSGTDPYTLFEEFIQKDPQLDHSHAFYL
ncbi:MAG: DUF6513 domain-containing protein, partial [Gemmataceae bacterium]